MPSTKKAAPSRTRPPQPVLDPAASLPLSLDTNDRITRYLVGYHVAQEAHHRGQIAMLARQSDHPLAQKIMFGMWERGSRGKEVG
jgi:hypothetical protein